MSEDETVKIGVGVGKGSSGESALTWAIDNELPPSRTVCLIHVYPPLRLIPTPMGNQVPVSGVNEVIVRRFQEERFKETEVLVDRYRRICQRKQVKAEECIVEGESIQQELVDHVFKLGLTKLVLGTSTRGIFSRAFGGETIAKFVAKHAPDFCTVLVVCKGKLLSAKEATESLTPSLTPASSDTASSISSEGSPRREFEIPRSSTREFRQMMSFPDSRHLSEQNPVQSSGLHRVRTAPLQRINESTLSEIEHDEVARHRETQRSLEELRCTIEEYRSILEEEKRLRREAEEIARKETAARQAIATKLRRLQQRTYTVYSFEDLAMATDNFSESNKIGEGGYGPVYKGELQHTTVAIKLLAHDGERGRREFEKEVELLSALHHPHMVMLLGACPEKACIVYEYMPNGSLHDRLRCKDGSPPLPWFVRFKICAEVAVALLFLHSRPEPIVHRDLKPGNILLDRNFASKIGDVGIAKLVPESITSDETTVVMGTPWYIDPDYEESRIVTHESDVYALGIIMLQLLTGKPAVRVKDIVEQAIAKDCLADILDRSAGAWPIEKAMDFALLALECSQPRRPDRADLQTRVLPVLQTFRAFAAEAELDSSAPTSDSSEIIVPNFLLCPISQEVMRNPHIAADGFTYDYESISSWLKDHDTSPMTNLQLEHKNLIPNYAVRSAVQSWHQRLQ